MYPVYIPSRGRVFCKTARIFQEYGVPFSIVVEPQEAEAYEAAFPGRVLVLPENDRGLVYARNWVIEHALAEGHRGCWQFDDNIQGFWRYKGPPRPRSIVCSPAEALAYAEGLFDRYVNLGLVGLNYYMFENGTRREWVANRHCYSAYLIRTGLPFRFRLAYNDDVDFCLQLLHTGYWCTALVYLYMVGKVGTRAGQGGGNHDTIYAGKGRELKPLALAAVWPQYVRVTHRFGGPHHHVKWDVFKHGLVKADAEQVRR